MFWQTAGRGDGTEGRGGEELKAKGLVPRLAAITAGRGELYV
jgi:hypothetical protein